MIIGYARTSTVEQRAGLDAQARDLTAAGCERVFSEHVSSASARAGLQQCLAYLRDGDVLVVTKPDRLARNTEELLNIEKDLSSREIGMIVLSMGGQRLDTRNPTSKLMLTILAGVTTWEREIMLERQKEGIAAAKAKGKFKGRKPTARAKAQEFNRLVADGKTVQAAAAAVGISEASAYRIRRACKAVEAAA
jgi:DNA invertase Pin-like site-specific DNA recombinase